MNILIGVLLMLTPEPVPPTVVVVVGAPGAPEYESQFVDWAAQWKSAAKKGGASFVLFGDGEKDGAVRERLKSTLADAAAEKSSPLWLVFIGHGTFDGRTAKFNLQGPDVSAEELADWLKPLNRPVAVINCASASAPFINRLAGPNRVTVTATKSGDEQNFARFGQYMSAAIADPAADLDKDDQVSLLEAYLTACRGVAEFYDGEARLATEHALLDDNGDGLGTPPAWFRGLRATQRAKEGAALDGTRAHQFHLVASDREREMPAERRERRDKLELNIAALRAEKEKTKEDDYYHRLEVMMIDLARLYETTGEKPAEPTPK